LSAEHRRQFVVDDLHQLLSRRDRPQLGDADRLLLDVLEELPGELEIHVGFQQHSAHFPKSVLDIGFGEYAAPTKPRENAFQLFGELFEHRPTKLAGGTSCFNARVLAI
jgi:hypothetical protein